MNHSKMFQAGRNGMTLVGALYDLEQRPKDTGCKFGYDESAVDYYHHDYKPIYFDCPEAIELLAAAIRAQLEHERQRVLKAAENPDPLEIFKPKLGEVSQTETVPF